MSCKDAEFLNLKENHAIQKCLIKKKRTKENIKKLFEKKLKDAARVENIFRELGNYLKTPYWRLTVHACCFIK